jgi:hypothetical protein
MPHLSPHRWLDPTRPVQPGRLRPFRPGLLFARFIREGHQRAERSRDESWVATLTRGPLVEPARIAIVGLPPVTSRSRSLVTPATRPIARRPRTRRGNAPGRGLPNGSDIGPCSRSRCGDPRIRRVRAGRPPDRVLEERPQAEPLCADGRGSPELSDGWSPVRRDGSPGPGSVAGDETASRSGCLRRHPRHDHDGDGLAGHRPE